MDDKHRTTTAQLSSTNETSTVNAAAITVTSGVSNDENATKDLQHTPTVTKLEQNYSLNVCTKQSSAMTTEQQESITITSDGDDMLHTTNSDDEVRLKHVVSDLPVEMKDRGVEFVICEGGEGGEDEIFESLEMGEGTNEMLLELNKELSKILDPQNTLRTPPPSVQMSPLECHALQTEEIETLQAIYDQDMTPLNDNCTCFMISIKFLSDEIQDDDVIKIWFSLPHNYPCVPPVFEIEANRSGSFSYKDADDLFDLLMVESINRTGGMMIFDLVSIAQEYMPALVERKKEQEAKQKELDLERKKTIELEDALKSRGVPREIVDVFFDEESKHDTTPDTSESGDEDGASSDGNRRGGFNVYGSYSVLKPAHFIGPISEIIKKLPNGLQVTRIENIMRQDLATRFQATLKRVNESLWQQERRNSMLYNLKPQIAFHGTRTTSLPSIVHHGLVIPGKGNAVQVRCGSSLGLGIYLSPNADFSLGYSDTGNRLIVCAALLGMMIKGAQPPKGKIFTYISYCGNEWVFFNAAQVLPCYVIQVKWTPNASREKMSHPPPLAGLVSNSSQKSDEDNERERKAKLLARARKFLPYGFGPGERTVIEAAASFDDDEEDYGDYQMMRYADENDSEWYDGQGVHEEHSELQKYRYRDPLERTLSIESEQRP